jgi:ABC-type Fe3+ transport system substrate-binding protein
MTVRPAAIALACIAMVVAALTSGEARAQKIAITPALNPALAKVIDAAKQEGEVDIRWTNLMLGGPDGATIAQDGINRMFGTNIKVQWSPGPAFGPMAAILYQEMQAGTPASSDVYTATPNQLAPYLDKGLFRTVDWSGLWPARITPAMVEGEGRALRYTDVYPGVLYNVKAAPWVPEIKVAADLLKPQYKGKFYTTPFLAGFDVLVAKDQWGFDKTAAFVKALSPQLAGLAGCETIDRIASGEIPALAIDCSGASPNRLAYRGKNILANHIISDMAERRPTYFAIPTHAPHANAAILYTLYLLSHEGQERIVWDDFGGDLEAFPDSHAHQTAAALTAQGIKFTDVSIAWWRAHPGIDHDNQELAKLVREK